jgi:hypothetical protein
MALKKRKAKLKLKAVQRLEEPGKAPIVRMVIDAEDAPLPPVEKIEEPIELLHPDEVAEPEKKQVLTWWQSLWQ